ncbi:MAG TPA: hypothetical protein VFZ85_17200 [Jiangellaceae bacterium]
MSRIAAFCADYLGKHGPTPVETIYQAAFAAGVTAARTSSSVTQAMRDRTTFVQLPDGRYTCAQHILVGATLTHRVSGDRAGDQYVWPGPELEPLRRLIRDLGEVPVEGGGTVQVDPYGREIWKVPAGRLDGVPRGGLLAFTWTGTHLRAAALESGVDRNDPRALEVRAVLVRHRRRALEDRHRYGYFDWSAREDLGRIVLSALTEAPNLLSEPVPPLDELLGVSPAEAVNQLYEGVADVLEREHRRNVTLDLPEPLYATLEARAGLLNIAPEEFMVALLGNEMWRTAPRGTVPYQPRYASNKRHLSAVPAVNDDDDKSWAG